MVSGKNQRDKQGGSCNNLCTIGHAGSGETEVVRDIDSGNIFQKETSEFPDEGSTVLHNVPFPKMHALSGTTKYNLLWP